MWENKYFPNCISLLPPEKEEMFHIQQWVGSIVANYHHPPNLTHIHTWLHSRSMKGSESIPREEWVTLHLGLFSTRSPVKSLTASISQLWPLTIWKQGVKPRSRGDESSTLNLWIHSLTYPWVHSLQMYWFTTLTQVLYGDQLYLESICWIHLFNQQICIEHLLTVYLERNKIDEVPDRSLL